MRKFNIKVDGVMHEVEVEEIGAGSVNLVSQGTNENVVSQAQAPTTKQVSLGAGSVVAPLQGTVQTVKVNVGDKVSSGDVVAIIEAMKMENEIPAVVSGTVKAIHVKNGAKVSAGDVILDIA